MELLLQSSNFTFGVVLHLSRTSFLCSFTTRFGNGFILSSNLAFSNWPASRGLLTQTKETFNESLRRFLESGHVQFIKGM